MREQVVDIEFRRDLEFVVHRTEPRVAAKQREAETEILHHGKLLAPPKDNLMLPGITYDVILELAAANGIPYEVRRVTKAEVFGADELLLSSSTKEVLAITTLDGKPVGNGKPGTMFAKLHPLYQAFKRDVMRK